MSRSREFESRLKELRAVRGWSQDDVARASGLSRAGVSAIETGRLVPSVAAAMALAEAFGCRVEDLFRFRDSTAATPAWAWAPSKEPCRYWRAEVGGREWVYPCEPTATGMLPHDGVFEGGGFRDRNGLESRKTLVLAGCDPAAGLLASELARAGGFRLLALTRSSRAALDLLRQGLVHAAGVHLAGADGDDGNAQAVRDLLGPDHRLVRVTRWDEGIAFAPSSRLESVSGALKSNLRWVGREPGSGARQCLDSLLVDRPPPRRIATDHRGVADAVRLGWADAGVCLRLVGEEAGLDFLTVRQEPYDLCFPTSLEPDPRLQALLQAIRSSCYRAALGDLPGYDPANAGDLRDAR